MKLVDEPHVVILLTGVLQVRRERFKWWNQVRLVYSFSLSGTGVLRCLKEKVIM